MTGSAVSSSAGASRRGGRVRALQDHLRLLNPYSLLWFVVAPVVTMALWLDGTSLDVGRLAALVASLALADAGLGTLNEVCDRDTDRASVEPERHTRPVASGRVAVRAAYAQVVVLSGGALALALAVSPALAGLLAVGLLYGVGYSVRPVRVSGRPIVSQLFWMVLWPGIYLGAYLMIGGDLARGLPYVAATVVFMGVAETLVKDIRDIDNDAATGKRTTPVAFGVPAVATVAVATFVVGAVGYVAAAALVVGSAALVAALAVVLGLWCVRAAGLAAELRASYDKATARALHEGTIQVFLMVNLLLIVALGAE